jgi:MFS family permease
VVSVQPRNRDCSQHLNLRVFNGVTSSAKFLAKVGRRDSLILDGLEVTIVGSLGPALQSAETLHLSSSNLGAVASFYMIGAVAGALGFGRLTDRFGRRLVFYVTLMVRFRRLSDERPPAGSAP